MKQFKIFREVAMHENQRETIESFRKNYYYTICWLQKYFMWIALSHFEQSWQNNSVAFYSTRNRLITYTFLLNLMMIKF